MMSRSACSAVMMPPLMAGSRSRWFRDGMTGSYLKVLETFILQSSTVIPAYAGIQDLQSLFVKSPGGRPGAGHFLLRGQMKVTKEKAALVSLRLRVPCV